MEQNTNKLIIQGKIDAYREENGERLLPEIRKIMVEICSYRHKISFAKTDQGLVKIEILFHFSKILKCLKIFKSFGFLLQNGEIFYAGILRYVEKNQNNDSCYLLDKCL